MLKAPAVLAGVVALTFVAAAPLALAMRGAMQAHLGRSLMADAAADGVNFDWWQEFASQSPGLGATFTPAVIGFASTLDGLSGLLDAQPRPLPVLGAAAAYLLAWTFLSGGILDRYARRRPTRADGFFAAAGVFFWRLLRLGVVAALAYWCLFTYVHAWLLDDAYGRLTRDLAAERQAFAWRLLLYAVFGLLLAGVNVTLEYARIRLVVEDRRSALGALKAALGFIGRHTPRVIGLYALNGLTFVALTAGWSVAAPGAGGAGWSMWAGLLAAQVWLLARLALKLQFMASQTALFQASLAHAGYTAAPRAVWPESAAAEMLGPG
ncbi:MAG: hypothetical protein A3F70_00020 [Acidobacteria bacterium RIFCSPLOWO2_12_FULL_67_14]|nr:MAG: hypothetical protein A3H29_09965 [Acidobacteria bacterium RIFCSPLOWO2_02_FULL_67_21]OFW40372.1 MAG: hypothetical protein A3F70_00020 [Acidobacteria bacterium RIFCSPLOWO2_12_FULL_67_14]